MTDIDEQERLETAAQRIRASSGLGRSHALHKLFDYLLERTLRGDAPKEVEIAADVFGRSDSDLLADASVRVYVHRLRKKLDDHYAGAGREEAERLTLPKGDYRFELLERTPDAPATEEDDAPALPPPAARRWRIGLALLAGLVVGAALTFAALRLAAPDDGLAAVRRSPIWAPLVASHKPLIVVPGDYYILGERDAPDADPARLVREFAVNSREDLDALLMDRPDLRGRYVDLNLYYLPVSTAYALESLMPIVAPGLSPRREAQTVPSSKLLPAQLKAGDIVYVGLISALGLLQDPVFANSRFAFAGSFDEIIDTDSGRVYVADPPQDDDTPRRNYAYVAMLPGPSGNRILIVAGTRDPALLQATDILSSPAALATLEKAGKDGYFEALYAVDGVGDENLKGTLIAAGPRSTEGMWNPVVGASAPAAGPDR